MQEVRWDIGGTVRKGDFSFFYGRGNSNYNSGIGIFVHHRIISAVKRVEFVSDRVLYIDVRYRRCNIIVVNVHAPREEKEMIQKGVFFYEELDQVFKIIFLPTI